MSKPLDTLLTRVDASRGPKMTGKQFRAWERKHAKEIAEEAQSIKREVDEYMATAEWTVGEQVAMEWAVTTLVRNRRACAWCKGVESCKVAWPFNPVIGFDQGLCGLYPITQECQPFRDWQKGAGR